MAVIDPPGKPLSAPQESRRYCETLREGSSAGAEPAKAIAASPTVAHLSSRHLPKASSWKIFKLLNHNLAWFLHRIFVTRNNIKDHPGYGLTRRRYPRCELMFGNGLHSGTCRFSANGLESCVSRFPTQHKRQRACGRRKSEEVFRNVDRLNFIFCIRLIRGATAAAKLYVHFAKVLFAGRFIEGKHTEDRGGF